MVGRVRASAHPPRLAALTAVSTARSSPDGQAGTSVHRMERVVLRVRLVSGDNVDVTYQHRDSISEDEAIDHVVSTLADESGVLRCTHGDRLLVLYARGVAAVEVAPRGAVL